MKSILTYYCAIKFLTKPIPMSQPTNTKKTNSLRHVLFGSLIGTTIEFFDFYIYANAAVLVFPQLFFPGSDPTTSTIESLATFSIAFFAIPIGSAVFAP